MSNEREDIEMNIKKLRELKKNKKGFTLIEIIVVIVILAVLMAVAVPSVLKYLDEADNAKYIAQARAVMQSAQAEVVKAYAPDQTISSDELTSISKNVVDAMGTDNVTITDLKIYTAEPTVTVDGSKLTITDTANKELTTTSKPTDVVAYSCTINGEMNAYIVPNGSIKVGKNS